MMAIHPAELVTGVFARSAIDSARLPLVQYREEDGVIDLGWGHPPQWALPVDDWIDATGHALRAYGWQSLTYGHATGPGPLVEWLAERLGRIDGRAAAPGEVFVTAGASQALELLCAELVRPGDAVVVDSPTYHLALRIIASHGVQIIRAPADDDGIDPAGTVEVIRALRRAGRRVPLLYLVPTFANPTGGCLPAARRAALVDGIAATGALIVEDDTYRELAYTATAPPSLWSIAERDTVVRVSSFSKTVAPGLRLGFLTGPAALVDRLARRGVVDSGGGLNHTTAMAMAAFAQRGSYDRHLARVLNGYAAQRDALVTAVRSALPGAEMRIPDGGWFLWVGLPAPARADRVAAVAPAYGVAALPGSLFGAQPGSERLRLSFSLFAPEVLADGAWRLGRAVAGAVADPAVEGDANVDRRPTGDPLR